MNYNKQKILSNILLFWKTWLGFLLLSCSSPSVPTDAIQTGKLPDIFPDYTGVTIPSNLCPTNFMLPDCDEAVACLSFGDLSFTYGEDNKIIIEGFQHVGEPVVLIDSDYEQAIGNLIE